MIGSRLRHRRAVSRRPPARPSPPPRIPARRGPPPRHLGTLYEISRLLSHFVLTVEEEVLALMAVVTKELPIRSAVLIERRGGRMKTISWHAPEADAAERRAAENRAHRTFSELTGRDHPRGRERTPAEAGAGRYVTLPLGLRGLPIFGVLHLAGRARFDEQDLEFASSVAAQLAGALDLYHARLGEIAQRKLAESSARRARREVARRKHGEDEVRRLNEVLERRVQERTALFQDTIRELHAFTYSIAHDLRAPLRHLHGYSEFLLGSVDEATRREYLQRMMSTTAGMDALIRDLLEYSRLTLEQVTLKPLSLAAAAARVRAALEPELAEKGAQLAVDAGLPAVMGHETFLIQALSNLVSNAVKFSRPGVAPRVRIRAETRGKRVRLWVEDNGIGIAPEHQERIFGVFQRLHKAEDIPGTGIGLAIVRRALERMKGSAGVESRLGHGSRFWIELARAEKAP